MFSCEFFKISKNTFFTEHIRTTASDDSKIFRTYLSNASNLQLSEIS